MQPEVGLIGPSALILGASRVLIILCPPTGATEVSVIYIGVAVR